MLWGQFVMAALQSAARRQRARQTGNANPAYEVPCIVAHAGRGIGTAGPKVKDWRCRPRIWRLAGLASARRGFNADASKSLARTLVPPKRQRGRLGQNQREQPRADCAARNCSILD